MKKPEDDFNRIKSFSSDIVVKSSYLHSSHTIENVH